MDPVEKGKAPDTFIKDREKRSRVKQPTNPLMNWDTEGYFPSIVRPVLLMVISIFLVETTIAYFMSNFINFDLPRRVVIDAGVTILLLLPIFYFILYRPFKKLDKARQQAQYENQLLTRKLIRRIEEERRHLARELHDDFGQVLTALQFGLETLRGSCHEPESQVHGCGFQVERLTTLISDLGDQVRSFTLGLRPAVLDEFGLHAALEVLSESDWSDLRVVFDEQGVDRRYAPEIELALFRICQEAMNNVAKHARATCAQIVLEHGDSEVQLTISDDGKGFDIRNLNPQRERRRGLGLLGMRERVASIGGHLEISSAPGNGTSIQVEVPAELQRRQDEANPDTDSR